MRIDLIYFDAGGGHRAAAEALGEVMSRDSRWKPRLVQFQEILDPIDPLRRLTGQRMQDAYNDMLRTGRTLGASVTLRILHGVVRMLHPGAVNLLEKFWWDDVPDMALSLVPNFNRTLKQGLERVAPGTPFATLLTDLADYPPHFWIEKQDQYLICGTPKAASQAAELGHPESKIFRTSGMVVHPRFYDRPPLDRAAERVRLGLHPDKPTALVLFGGQGSRAIVDILDRLSDSGLDLQAIAICGKNAELLSTLQKRHLRMPIFPMGFTREIPRFMRLSDFLIGKPGPGSVSEAMVMGLPVIVECNAWTLPQERYNAQWIAETGAGIVLRSFKQIESAVAEMLDPAHFSRFRAAAAAIDNRAVFEVPEILERIVQESRHAVSDKINA